LLPETPRGAGQQDARYDEFALVDLAKSLQTACGIYRVADGSKRSPSPIAHIADNGRTKMKTNPHRQGRIEFGSECFIQGHQLYGHLTRGAQGLSTGGYAVSLKTKQGHDAIARELVDAPSGRLNRGTHRPAITIQQENDVIGELSFGDAGEITDVGEQNRDLPLAALPLAARSRPATG
jgi:hypothetical protein